MKVIVAGSRTITDPFHVMEAIRQADFITPLPTITEIVSGGAAGVDTCGERCAEALGIPLKRFPAKWDKYGKYAGFVRNQQMGWYADALVAVWDGQSNGTRHMIQQMQRLKKPVYVYTVEGTAK